MAAGLRTVTADDIVGQLESLLPAVDQAVLTGEAGEHMAEVFRWAVATGIWAAGGLGAGAAAALWKWTPPRRAA